MTNLDKIVDLRPVADFCGAHCSSVNACVGLDVYPAAHAYWSGLWDLFPMTCFVLGEAETVRTNDGAIFQCYVIAQDAVLTHDGMGVSEKVAANLRTRIENDMRQQRGVWSEAHLWANHDIGADMCACTNLGSRIDDCGGVNSRGVDRRLIEESQCAGKGVVGILDP